MLFQFAAPGAYPFWMKDMHFPLDIIWLSQGKVVALATLSPPGPGQEPVAHDPGVAADQVVEINAGLAAKDGISVGMQLDIQK